MEEELRELRLDLKSAQNDVKRYASYALHLQQDLAREKLKRSEKDGDKDILEGEDARFPNLNLGILTCDKKVEKARKEHVAWSRKLDQAMQMLDERRGEAVDKQKNSTRDNQREESVSRMIESLGPFLQQQRSLIGKLGRENAQLREMLCARPTRRAMLVSQLEVERLQRYVRKLRLRIKSCAREPSRKVPQEDQSFDVNLDEDVAAKKGSLSERMLEERLLQSLKVNTENSTTYHKYLNEKLRCYLSLNAARLVAKQQELTETGILEKVGRICSDLVASCCYVLEVEEVGELPKCVLKAQQLAHVSTAYQNFVERIEKLLKRFDKDAFYAIRAESTANTSCLEALEMITTHVNDVLVELDARREQMKPPGSKAHEVLLANMKLLQVAHIDQLIPTIRRLMDNMRAEQEFQRSLRELFGLDESANRKQILHIASVLFGELGFLTGNAPFQQSSTASPRYPNA